MRVMSRLSEAFAPGKRIRTVNAFAFFAVIFGATGGFLALGPETGNGYAGIFAFLIGALALWRDPLDDRITLVTLIVIAVGLGLVVWLIVGIYQAYRPVDAESWLINGGSSAVVQSGETVSITVQPQDSGRERSRLEIVPMMTNDDPDAPACAASTSLSQISPQDQGMVPGQRESGQKIELDLPPSQRGKEVRLEAQLDAGENRCTVSVTLEKAVFR